MLIFEELFIVLLYAFFTEILIGGFLEMFAYTRSFERRVKVKTF